MPKLTKRLVDSLEPRKSDYVEWDGDLSGFGIRVWPSGRKSFVLWFRNASGRARKMTLGAYGQLTVDQARKLALGKLAEIATGDDPAEKKVSARRGNTVSELADRYLSEHAIPKKKPESVKADRRLLNTAILPRIGRRAVPDVSRKDIGELHHAMRKTPVQANRVIALLSKMFNLAEAWGLRPDGSNPCRHIQKFKERGRERFLSGEEMVRLAGVLDEAQETGQESPVAVAAIRLLLFSGMRKTEVLTLEWTHVDLDRQVADLPDSKTGKKTVHLSAPALAVLADLPRLKGNPYVFPGRKPGSRFVGLQKVWERIRSKADIEDVRLHDLRHTFASVGVTDGLSLPMIGKLLGQKQASTTLRYAHLAEDPQKEATEQIGRRITDAMTKKSHNGKVIQLWAKSKG